VRTTSGKQQSRELKRNLEIQEIVLHQNMETEKEKANRVSSNGMLRKKSLVVEI
jgi:hypothetical protein